MGFGPKMLIPLALSAAGSAIGGRAQKQVNRKQSQVADYYRQKNLTNRNQAMAFADQGINEYTPDSVQAKMTQGAEDRNRILLPETGPNMDRDYTGGAPDVTRRDISRRIIDTVKAGREETSRLSRLNSYGDMMFGASRNTVRPRDMVSMIGNFSQGNAGLVPGEMQAATHAGDRTQSIADLFKAAGMMSSMYFGMGTPDKITWNGPRLPG